VALPNSPSVHDSKYAFIVVVAPVSIKVLKPLKAYVQSALEKKSAFTLKEPQSVQIKGKIDIVSQNNIKILFTIIICFEYLLIV
jgi:hypothetical protein